MNRLSEFKRSAPWVAFSMVLIALIAMTITACQTTPTAGPLPTPTFGQLHIPDPSAPNGWSSYSSSSGLAEVLPTRGRGVRIYFYAPVGSTFGVSLRGLDGTLTSLPENQGTPVSSAAGYFQIVEVNVSQNPPVYVMYVRAPAALMDPANFDILVVNRSLRSDRTDSAPMIVRLRQRKVTRVTVRVEGSGRVVSAPAGIQCGVSPSGAPLTDCTYDFGLGQVRLAPNSNNSNRPGFLRWTGNCDPNVQTCELTLDGTAAMQATAHFDGGAAPLPPVCAAAPAIPGLRWVSLPNCSDPGSNPGITLACDAQGYFCCAPDNNSSNARCGGQGRKFIEADCRPRIDAMLRQPGGCYEVDSFP